MWHAAQERLEMRNILKKTILKEGTIKKLL